MKMHAALSTSIALVLGTAAMAGVSRPAEAEMVNDTPPGTSLCTDVDINDASEKVINCLMNDERVVFYKAGSSAAVQLPPLAPTPGGVSCVGSGISNAPAGSGIIVGECSDANDVWQAVFWKINALGSAPTLLAPNAGGLLGLGAGVKTVATAMNAAGVIVGESIDGSNNGVLVRWLNNGVATPLSAPGLLGVPAPTTNCIMADISDAIIPRLVGDCPAGAGNEGKYVAALWTNANNNYVVLPVAPGASYCVASKINFSGQIMGKCIYGTGTYKVVRWAAGGTTPPDVMQTVNNVPTLRTSGVDMNDGGKITGSYLIGGLTQPFRWDPSTGSNGVGIALPRGGGNGTPIGIGSNDKIVGNYFIPATGTSHPFVVQPTATVAVDQGTCSGGTNAMMGALSKNGTQEAGMCINGSGNALAEEGAGF